MKFGIHKILFETPHGVYEAKGDQETAMNDVKTSRTQQGAGYGDYLSNVKDQRMPAGQAKNERDQIWSGATDYAATGGVNEDNNARIRQAGQIQPGTSSGGGGGGGNGGPGGNYGNAPGSAFNYVGPSAFTNNSAIDNPINDLGNVDASRYGDVRNQIGKLNDFAATGGMTAQDYKDLNRDNFYEFEKTGGYDDKQLADIRGRSNSTVPAFYQNLQDTMAQNRLKSGGYGGAAFDASSAKMARQGAQGAADQTRNTEIDLANAVRQGRMSASQQLAANKLGVIQYTTPAKEAALAAAGSTSLGLANTINQGLYSSGQLALAKAKGVDDYTINVASGKDKYATAEDQIAAQRAMASAGIASNERIQQASLNSQNERFISSQQQQGQQFGMGQLADIYRSSNGQQSADNRDYLGGLNGYAGSQNQNLGIEANLSSQKGAGSSFFDNLMKGLGAFGGSGVGSGNNTGGTPPTSGNPWAGSANDPTSPDYTPNGPNLPPYYPGAPGYPGDDGSTPNNPMPPGGGGGGNNDPGWPDNTDPTPFSQSKLNYPSNYTQQQAQRQLWQ